MINLISSSEKKHFYTQSSMNLHGVEEIQVIHEPAYTEVAISGGHGITLRLFHKGERDIPLTLAVIDTSPPPPPVEDFPDYPLT